MSFVYRGNRSDVESGLPELVEEPRESLPNIFQRVHSGGRSLNSNIMAFLVTVLMLFMILNSYQLSPNFLLWLVLGVFLMVTALRMYATCQQLQAYAQAQTAAASSMLGHTELRLQVPPSIAFATRGRLHSLRLQLALLDRDFDDLDYDALRALDADTPPDAPAMTEEEINALPVHIYKSQSQQGSASGFNSGGSAKQRMSSSSSSGNEKRQDTSVEVEDELTCSVCLEQVNEAEEVKSLPCLHQFHSNCIDPWLRQQGTCPICKYRAGSRSQESGDGEGDASYMV